MQFSSHLGSANFFSFPYGHSIGSTKQVLPSGQGFIGSSGHFPSSHSIIICKQSFLGYLQSLGSSKQILPLGQGSGKSMHFLPLGHTAGLGCGPGSGMTEQGC